MVIKTRQIRAVKLLDAPLEICHFLFPNCAQNNILPLGFRNGGVWSRMAAESSFFSYSFTLHSIQACGHSCNHMEATQVMKRAGHEFWRGFVGTARALMGCTTHLAGASGQYTTRWWLHSSQQRPCGFHVGAWRPHGSAGKPRLLFRCLGALYL